MNHAQQMGLKGSILHQQPMEKQKDDLAIAEKGYEDPEAKQARTTP